MPIVIHLATRGRDTASRFLASCTPRSSPVLVEVAGGLRGPRVWSGNFATAQIIRRRKIAVTKRLFLCAYLLLAPGNSLAEFRMKTISDDT